MAGNTFGQLFRLTTFGESHGNAIGGILDGCPAGLIIDEKYIQEQLDRRKPGQSSITTQRRESDEVQIISGVFEGKSTGAPIAFILKNEDVKSEDYDHLKDSFRPSHADYTYFVKYGHRDHRGGGRSSARETACRVAGGAIARLLLNEKNISIKGYVSAVGMVECLDAYTDLNLARTDESPVRCPHPEKSDEMLRYIEKLRDEGDSCGGIISLIISNVPVGLGEPVFDRLEADLAKAMLSINAVKGFEIGSGFAGTRMKGSEHNDIFIQKNNKTNTATNNSGGIQGGISNGEDIVMRVAFKPVATIMQKQESLDKHGNKVILEGKGRHDPCVVPRAVPIVEAMAALVMADHLLRNSTSRLDIV
jgi:chorismate synthase